MKTRRRSSVIPSLNTDSTGQAYKSDPSEEQKQCVETDILSHLEVLAIYYFHSAGTVHTAAVRRVGCAWLSLSRFSFAVSVRLYHDHVVCDG
jgi:hypothetical protein